MVASIANVESAETAPYSEHRKHRAITNLALPRLRILSRPPHSKSQMPRDSHSYSTELSGTTPFSPTTVTTLITAKPPSVEPVSSSLSARIDGWVAGKEERLRRIVLWTAVALAVLFLLGLVGGLGAVVAKMGKTRAGFDFNTNPANPFVNVNRLRHRRILIDLTLWMLAKLFILLKIIAAFLVCMSPYLVLLYFMGMSRFWRSKFVENEMAILKLPDRDPMRGVADWYRKTP
ncbi:hypothetical protein EDC01DRAFT_777619 [Geopyxis carbonaria]|nr:hypothetical protein EDC01DRAFT_777619 [Geopyxis carbonaria]